MDNPNDQTNPTEFLLQRIAEETWAAQRLIELHRIVPREVSDDCGVTWRWTTQCSHCQDGDADYDSIPAVCPTVALRLATYTHHPDFDPDWLSGSPTAA